MKRKKKQWKCVMKLSEKSWTQLLLFPTIIRSILIGFNLFFQRFFFRLRIMQGLSITFNSTYLKFKHFAENLVLLELCPAFSQSIYASKNRMKYTHINIFFFGNAHFTVNSMDWINSTSNFNLLPFSWYSFQCKIKQ